MMIIHRTNDARSLAGGTLEGMSSGLELRHLSTLIALAETGNLSKAARRLHLSQPAISHQIRSVEESYGAALFERKSSPLRLSALGQRLVELAYEVHGQMRDAERDLKRIASGHAGQLRVAVECHSCFDWLMPSMDAFRERWPEVELDLVSGFQPDPVGLLAESRADLVIVSRATKRRDVIYHPLFGYEVLALFSKNHPLSHKSFVTAQDFRRETLVTYPIPDERLDFVRDVLIPADVAPQRRTTELTVAILQLVASGRGVAALPGWTVQPYLDHQYVIARTIGRKGLFSQLYAATTTSAAKVSYVQEFIGTTKRISFSTLQRISPV